MDVSTLNLIIGGAIGVIGASAGAIINGFMNRSTAKMQISYNRQETKRQLRNAKLEELKVSINQCVNQSNEFIKEIESKPSLSTLAERNGFIDKNRLVSIPLGLNHQIITVYAPEILNVYNEFSDAVQMVAALRATYLLDKFIDKKTVDKVQLKMMNVSLQVLREIDIILYTDIDSENLSIANHF